MKKVLVWAAILQVACTFFLYKHISYLRGEYGQRRFETGKDIGELDAYSKLRNRGIELPDDVRTHPDQDRMIDLGTSVHELMFLLPASLIQLFVIIMLVGAAYRSKPSVSNSE